jgi:hypothetical protein
VNYNPLSYTLLEKHALAGRHLVQKLAIKMLPRQHGAGGEALQTLSDANRYILAALHRVERQVKP